MFVLVQGHNKSGKSRFAEILSAKLSQGSLVYLATFVPVGDGVEGAATVARHRKQRQGMGFATMEKPIDVSGAELPEASTVLLEDVSNLLGNNLFGPQKREQQSVFNDIIALKKRCCHLVAVSISGLTASPEYDAPTCEYIAKLNSLNEQLVLQADSVIEMQNRIPHLQKGKLPMDIAEIAKSM